MSEAFTSVDPDGLLEYSVVYSDHSLNHMSERFKQALTDVSSVLKHTYNAAAAVVVPGSGTFGMEAVARQFATGRRCMIIRNGWFSYRWTQIFEMGNIPESTEVLHANRLGEGPQAPFAPAPIEAVVETIRRDRPDMVFAPHVETSAGLVLPDDYLRLVADAVHEVGGLFVLDCIASGTHWVDMAACGVDILVSAPQKGWSATPCCGLVMLGERARSAIDATQSTSFACDLRKWLQIMEAYEAGGHAYHATMPTDGLVTLRDTMRAIGEFGFDKVKQAQLDLGGRVREMLEANGFPSVAAEGFKASGVVVSYTTDPDIRSGAKFAQAGVQVAAGVPLMCEEGDDFQTFRIGLFGLEKLRHVDRTVERLEQVVRRIRA